MTVDCRVARGERRWFAVAGGLILATLLIGGMVIRQTIGPIAAMLAVALSAGLVGILLRRPLRRGCNFDGRTLELGRANRMLGLLQSCRQALAQARAECELGLWVSSILVREGGYRGAHLRLDPGAPYDEREDGVAASFPLRGTDVSGALVVRAGEDGFEAAEASTLATLAADLAFGISALRVLAARDRSEALFRGLVENSMVGVYVIQDGHFTYVNRKMADILGYAVEDLNGRPAFDIVAPADRELVANNMRRRMTGEASALQYQFRGLKADGSQVPIEVLGSTALVRGCSVVIGSLVDLSERSRFVESIRLRDRAIESSANGVMITDAVRSSHPIIYVNPAFARITGYGQDEVMGRRGRFLLGTDWDQPELAEMRAALREKREAKVVLRNYRKNGEMFWNELSLSPVRDDDGSVTHFVSIFNDVSERVEQERLLTHQATHDGLTGLANRALLADRISQACRLAERGHKSAALLLVDIDRFKFVNDSMGRGAGDVLLKAVAERLSELLRASDTVARLGGDEFVVLLGEQDRPEDAAKVAVKINQAIAQPFAIAGRELFVSASIGISVYPRDGGDAEALIRNADAAMYRVKAEGRDDFRFYGPEMNARALARVELEADLRHALAKGELSVHYQPKACLGTGRISGAEALLRWTHPTRGAVSPADFIPLAEETGLIVPIGDWVLARVVRQTLAWKAMGYPLRVSVNLSPCQLRHPGAVDRIAAVLWGSGADPALLELELTESSVMDPGIDGQGLLQRLRDLGLQLSLDDFGTGYSSLSYLSRFPLDILKIDRSFIQGVMASEGDASIVATIIAMARGLKMKVVAEGVETHEQAAFLRRQNCDEMQGFLFSRPVPTAAFEAMLKQGAALPCDPGVAVISLPTGGRCATLPKACTQEALIGDENSSGRRP